MQGGLAKQSAELKKRGYLNAAHCKRVRPTLANAATIRYRIIEAEQAGNSAQAGATS